MYFFSHLSLNNDFNQTPFNYFLFNMNLNNSFNQTHIEPY